MKENVKVDKVVLDKVRRHTKKTKQTLGGFVELALKNQMAPNLDALIVKWKEKAEKWDALYEKVAAFYPEQQGDTPEVVGDLENIGEVACRAFGFL